MITLTDQLVNNPDELNIRKYKGNMIRVVTMNNEYLFIRKPFSDHIWFVDSESSHVDKYEEIEFCYSAHEHFITHPLFHDEIRIGYRLCIKRINRPEETSYLTLSTTQGIEAL